MQLVKIKCRLNDSKTVQLKELGIETHEFQLKEVYFNPQKICFIDNYEGFCCINFSALGEDCLITNIPYSEISFFKRF